ncbi:hypothetical protein [Pseudoxanthomonas composti]|uniref:Uncharacterized protein n=1 Tax=Pseudoxanthomonas composti TaxID=2137479 RepID=A0A4Q1JR69_9GAMM|nr:hypothetical protein [Pseudoxanthomonas composti]RXQ99939.1 hypothetical protein EPA99_17620 [Pseudoxanthomonas composti]
MQIHTVAIYVDRGDGREVVYVGDAIEIGGEAWLVLTWDCDEKNYPVEKLPLDVTLLVREPPPDANVIADWHVLVRTSRLQ